MASSFQLDFDWPAVQCRPAIGGGLIQGIPLGLHGAISVHLTEGFTDIGVE